MMTRWALTALVLVLAGCQKSDTKILIGATTVTAPGAMPIEGSVIVITGKTIRAVGLQKDVPIPQDSQRLNLAGKWIVPAVGGKIAAGEPADLMVLDQAPPGTSGRRRVNGEWQGAP
jgi:cytosine/adenosine deaminase-related metal-dependent hydrolase